MYSEGFSSAFWGLHNRHWGDDRMDSKGGVFVTSLLSRRHVHTFIPTSPQGPASISLHDPVPHIVAAHGTEKCLRRIAVGFLKNCKGLHWVLSSSTTWSKQCSRKLGHIAQGLTLSVWRISKDRDLTTSLMPVADLHCSHKKRFFSLCSMRIFPVAIFPVPIVSFYPLWTLTIVPCNPVGQWTGLQQLLVPSWLSPLQAEQAQHPSLLPLTIY